MLNVYYNNMKIGAFILNVGQSTVDDCIKAIKGQVDKVFMIQDVSPVNKAINQCFKEAMQEKLDYFIILGADTIHKENSIATMMSYMKDDLWCVYGRLDDYYRGSDSYGNHLYNAKAMQGIRVDEDDIMYDHKIHATMEEKGYKKVVTKEVIGKHHPIWTVQEAFEKHLHSGKRYKDKYFKKYFDQVKKRYKEDPCEVNRAAKIGFQLGIGCRPDALTNKETKEWKENKKKFKINDKLVW